MPKLGVNIDHVATLRQARGTPYPDLLAAAREHLERARAILSDLPDSPYRRELLAACDLVLA